MKKVVCLLVLTFMVLSFVSVSAQNLVISVEVSASETGPDIVNLTFDCEVTEGWVSAYIVDKLGKVVDVKQKRVDGNNSLELKILHGYPTTEEYTAYVAVNALGGDNFSGSETFKYYSYAQQQEAIAAILGATDVPGKIAEKKYVLSLNLDGIYSEVENKTLITNKLLLYLNALPEVDRDIFINALEYCSYLAFVNEEKTANIEKAISQYAEKYGIDTESKEYAWYLGATNKSMILGALTQVEYQTIDDFAQQFKAVNFLYKLSNEHYLNIISFLRTHNGQYTGLNLDFGSFDTRLNTTAKKEYAASLLASKFFNNFGLLESDFNVAITAAEAYAPAVPPQENSGSSQSIVVGTPGVVPSVPNIPSTSTPKFSDISSVPWAAEAITTFAKEGIISGVDNEHFEPEANVTREQFIKIIVEAFGLSASDKLVFNDVNEKDWFYPYVNCAAALGIVQGYDGRFGVGDTITRQDMAIIIYRVAKIAGIDITPKNQLQLADHDEISDYAKEAVDVLYQSGYVSGMGNGKFEPYGYVTRAQAVKLIYSLWRTKK